MQDRRRDLLHAGMLIGKYRLESSLRGGMGEVWRAVDTSREKAGRQRHVALKFLAPELLGNDDEIARIQSTFDLVEKLDHPHICHVFDLDVDQTFGWYQVMRWVEGRTLSQYRQDHGDARGRLPLDDVVRLIAPVADALDNAHQRKVLHRDIKPQNIMVDADGHVSVIDFGLATWASGWPQFESSSHESAGMYMQVGRSPQASSPLAEGRGERTRRGLAYEFQVWRRDGWGFTFEPKQKP